MTLTFNKWLRPETGGVISFLVFITIIFCYLLYSHAVKFYDIKAEIISQTQAMDILNNKLTKLTNLQQIQQKKSKLFKVFKRKKWDQPLTEANLNKTIYALQRKCKIEFVSIKLQPGTTDQAVNLHIGAQVMQDNSFMQFLQKLENELPGIVTIKQFEIKRTREINADILQKIKRGEKISLFECSIDLIIER